MTATVYQRLWSEPRDPDELLRKRGLESRILGTPNSPHYLSLDVLDPKYPLLQRHAESLHTPRYSSHKHLYFIVLFPLIFHLQPFP
ncbi:hypothetical protein Pmani_011445 [Petrolisthes manimaculis]|uniref:Uncharacterized protein n=1 Tax=Petrolisthes manimaculis TaxID=1843537 RepID=A0AAE1Q2C8_9EUCA|nr:hypothetical protein Pmani_011445 [Petrolisthes manimaculis]